MSRFFYNEEINAARLALRTAAAEFREFADADDQDLISLFLSCLNVEGIMQGLPANDYDLWDRIRRKV